MSIITVLVVVPFHLTATIVPEGGDGFSLQFYLYEVKQAQDTGVSIFCPVFRLKISF